MQLWAGSTVPDGYALCDGRQLSTKDYPELYKALGTTFNNAYNANGSRYTTTSGFFRLPDLRGRFIVGYNDLDDEYNKYGNTGGEKRHTLTIDEMPEHSHGYTIYSPGSKDRQRYSHKSNRDSDTDEKRTTESAGSNAAHENRPPYYTLAYIMKVR